jgi:hypothetical protein
VKTAAEIEPHAIDSARSVSQGQSLLAADSPVSAQTSLSLSPVLSMQGSLGNRAARQILAAEFLQPKLTVGAPDDIYEKEADAVAEDVLARTSLASTSTSGSDGGDHHRGLAGKAAHQESAQRNILRRIPIHRLQQSLGNKALARLFRETFATPAMPQVGRKCSCGGDAKEECAECREKRLARQSSSVSADCAGSVAPPIVEDVLATPGQPLADSAGRTLEPGFGHDFSGVRVDDDSKAAESASSVNALAYTVGNHIVFNAGQYSPGTSDGNRLLAHELTHTIQQTGGMVRPQTDNQQKKHQDVRSGSAGGTTVLENGTLHRQGAPPQTTAPTSSSWKPPFGLDPVTTHEEAREATLAIYVRIANLNSELKEAGETDAADKLELIAQEAVARSQSMAGATPITEKEASDLTEFGKDADKADTEAIGILSRKAEEGLASIANAAPPDTSAIEDELAESLHDAFRKGSTDRVGELKETIEKLNKYKEKVSSVLTWAKRAATAAKAAKTAEQLESAIGKLESAGGVLDKVGEVLTAAHAFATITGLDNKAVSPTQDSINKFQAGLDTIDLAMGYFKAVPLLGTLWSSYYKPLTQECLRLIGVIDRYQDIENRQFGLLEFWEQRSSGGRKSGQAPTIPSYLLDSFPGGQSVLDFMFAIMHDGVPQPTSAVETFFLDHRELFNVKQESWDKLEGEGGSHWYKPWTWGDEEILKNLIPWVQRNRRTVWSMLYGSLNPDL